MEATSFYSLDKRNEAAKQCAILHCDGIIIELDQLMKPEYATFIVDRQNPIDIDGYEKIDYWQSIKEAIQNL
jgi:hypothetical protein